MTTLISDISIKMLGFYKGNIHDINHFMKVYAFAKLIGEKEGLDEGAQCVLEAAAVLHDIACPLCREKYGSARGDLQEMEGMPLTEELLAEFKLPEDFVRRVVWLVGHHHSTSDVKGLEHRILLEADYLVNAHEGGHSVEQIRQAGHSIFRTETGKALLREIYG